METCNSRIVCGSFLVLGTQRYGDYGQCDTDALSEGDRLFEDEKRQQDTDCGIPRRYG